jgi:integrase
VPLKIIAGRNAKTKNLYIRGTHLKVRVDQTSGTDRRAVARRIRDELERAIERGEYPPQAAPRPDEPTFISAAIRYLEVGDRSKKTRRYVDRLAKHFGSRPLSEIDQRAIDEAAIALHPLAGPGTRNAAVYTPTSAILRSAGIKLEIKRPKGAKGRVVTAWLTVDDAFGILAAAERFDLEFATLLKFLLYTGVRLGAALNLQREEIRLEEARAWVRHQKGQPATDVRLQDDLRAALELHLESHDRRRVFRFHQGAHLRHQLTRAKLAYLKMPCPVRYPVGWRPAPYRLDWANFHTFRHTWATWMRRAGADVLGLVATGNWRDQRSASRYAHAVARDEWSRVDLLPSAGTRRGIGKS